MEHRTRPTTLAEIIAREARRTCQRAAPDPLPWRECLSPEERLRELHLGLSSLDGVAEHLRAVSLLP